MLIVKKRYDFGIGEKSPVNSMPWCLYYVWIRLLKDILLWLI